MDEGGCQILYNIRSHYQMDFRIGDGAERQGSGFVEAWGAKGGAFLPV